MNREMTRKLSSLCSKDPFYLGWYLARYSEIESTDAPGMAVDLGCLPEVINTMSLSRSPRAESPHFRHDVEAIAERFQVRPDRLANIVRTVRVHSQDAFLMAARDREPGDGPTAIQDDDTP